MTPLNPPLAKLERLLLHANGRFVSGRVLANGADIPMATLCNAIAKLTTRRPDLAIEGKRGSGYRIAKADTPAATPAAEPKLVKLPPPMTANERVAATATLLDLLRPRTAELVKTIALESGETADNCIMRLIAYGAEVHHSLVTDGDNPVGLPAPRIVEQSTRH